MRKLGKLINKLDPRRILFFDLNDYRKTIFLAGTGRSGTTWLEDIVNYTGSCRIMFEPFHSRKVSIINHFAYRQYINPNNRDRKFIEPVEIILSGRIRNSWIDQFNKSVIPGKRIIKDIRAHLMLKWIKEVFPEISMILLLRHPCAVACSKLRSGWDTHLEEFLDQEELMDDYLNPFKGIIEYHYKRKNNDFNKHILMWCIENYIPLKQFKKDEIQIIFYENLCINPEEEARRIFDYLGENYSIQKVMDIIRRPSALSHKESAIYSMTSLIDGWKRKISYSQIQAAIEMLNLFGLQKIYSEDLTPHISEDEVFLV